MKGIYIFKKFTDIKVTYKNRSMKHVREKDDTMNKCHKKNLNNA